MACAYAQLRNVEYVSIKDYMTLDVITINPESPLAEAARLFLIHGISGLPVVDEKRKIQGILTEADLLSAIGLACKRPACGLWYKLEQLFKHERHIRSLIGRVGDLMYEKPVYIQESKSLHDAIELMKKWHIKKLIVADADECVSGIITRSNIIKALLERGMLGPHLE
jgi:predicted transcriptional regulator